jgi:hypothetical protein
LAVTGCTAAFPGIGRGLAAKKAVALTVPDEITPLLDAAGMFDIDPRFAHWFKFGRATKLAPSHRQQGREPDIYASAPEPAAAIVQLMQGHA